VTDGSASLDAGLARGLAFLRRRITGDYEVDDLGHDPDLTDTVLLAPLRPLFEHWFRGEVLGVEHVPASGGALLVGNHSGTIALDALIVQLVLRDRHPQHRALRMLAGDVVFEIPGLAPLARAAGHLPASPESAATLLDRGELVGVWPEGYRGTGKPFAQRYRLQPFGRGGFVSAALRADVPIVPVAVVGAEESYPMIADVEPLARLLHLPYFPVTPTFPLLGPLGALPLPARWVVEFGEPVDLGGHGPDDAEDPQVVFALADRVRDTIQEMLERLLVRRGPAFG
jgi:1-acyl-sn-glycerol-3-phosphate acyltransferase